MGRGKQIVLAACTSESSEYMRSTWRQMLLATLPAKYASALRVNWSTDVETTAEGEAKYVPNGLRVVEALLAEKFGEENVVVCYPNELELFVGEDTRAIGVHAHNPLGITFATDVYVGFFGRDVEPINAAEFRKLIHHPVIKQHKKHLKLILGGPGAWQIEHKKLQHEWGIDCVVNGEAEEIVQDLFERAVRGDSLPLSINCDSPKLESIPTTRHRSTFGVVEITRGCGRGCQFCSVALRGGKSIPMDQVLANVRRQVDEGADTITLVTEDLFLYKQGKGFNTNGPALKELFQRIAEVPGVNYFTLTHGTMTPAVTNPEVIEELSPWAVGMSPFENPHSTRPDNKYAMMFVGLETGSVRLFKKYMKGKCYPYRPEQWPDVVMKGMEVMNRHNWFPMCTFIVGLPGETREDTKESLDLLYSLKDAKWVVIPTLFVPLEDTRMQQDDSAKLANLTDLQWEFFFTCWRYNVDFMRNNSATKHKLNFGIPMYYWFLGRKMFGPEIKWPLFRLGHLPERWMRNKMYLDFSDHREPRYRAPELLEIPEHRNRTQLPVLTS